MDSARRPGVEAATRGGPLTLVNNGRSELCPCKGWPPAPACGGFGLDKSIAPSIVAHHSINEQERANFEGHPLGFQKRRKRCCLSWSCGCTIPNITIVFHVYFSLTSQTHTYTRL